MPLTDPDKAEVKVIVHEAINGRNFVSEKSCADRGDSRSVCKSVLGTIINIE